MKFSPPASSTRLKFLSSLLFLAAAFPARGETAKEITQYGITWTFDKPHEIGRFVTGDYWVVGPVTVVGVSPVPGKAAADAAGVEHKSIYGASGMKPDPAMRNGSMIVLQPGPKQGYDSRLVNYDPALSVAFPCNLPANQSLVSSVSYDGPPVPVLLAPLMWASEKNAALALKSAAVLTCLDKAPPADAFRPPYVGSTKPIFETKDLQWALLPKLAPPPGAAVPSWDMFDRFFERPWLDHQESWLLQMTGPIENQVNYGREFQRATATASLMLMLDVPRAQKEKLMVGVVQFGIDTYGLAKAGRQWSADGGHWNGRKWPLLFAGLMLGNKDMQAIPGAHQTVFSEDQQTYYGKGAAGQSALYQMVFHTGARDPYEEKAPGTWGPMDTKSEGYRHVNSPAYSEAALACLLMKAKALWNHDAFFDYCDRYMARDDAYAAARGGVPRPKQEGKTWDDFDTAMWQAYRDKVPAQPGGKDNVKWVNAAGGGMKQAGSFVSNPKGT